MVASVIICVISAGLFVYWLRYTCLLILQARAHRNFEEAAIEANRLEYREVRERLEVTSSPDQFPQLASKLERDYRLLTCLLRYGADFKVGGYTVEQRLLMLDYAMMKLWYRVAGKIAPEQARRALCEMSQIVGQFANAVGERAAVTVQD